MTWSAKHRQRDNPPHGIEVAKGYQVVCWVCHIVGIPASYRTKNKLLNGHLLTNENLNWVCQCAHHFIYLYYYKKPNKSVGGSNKYFKMFLLWPSSQIISIEGRREEGGMYYLLVLLVYIIRWELNQLQIGSLNFTSHYGFWEWEPTK